MLFSELFEIELDGTEKWFDPLLTLDTQLYIDPFLIFQDEFGPFVGAHQELIAFYDAAFQLVAESGETKSGTSWQKAISILGTPEVEEMCLGVTASGTGGAGSGKGKARLIAEALHKAIQFGLSNPKHFETMQLFQEGIAEDTISDAVGNILRHRFATFTKSICNEHGVDAVSRPHLRGRFNPLNRRWEKIDVEAPLNPFSGKQVLLVPKEYLRPMPTLNPSDFWGFCCDQSAQELRTELGEEITRNVKKDVILEKALTDYDSVEDFVAALERIGGAPYDFEADPKGLVKWYRKTKEFVKNNPLTFSFTDQDSFSEFVVKLVQIFKNFVENQGGWELVYNDDGKPKSESACQRLFLGIVRHYCLANDIDVSPEVNIGRGPVDFKLSRGSTYTALIEMKLAKNTKFWAGLEKQLPKYLEAEEVKVGHFLIVAFSDADVKRLNKIYERVGAINDLTGYDIKHSVVEAIFRPPSASVLP
ncbi:hypothetical protein [Sulfitobacter geojensis]|uniref:Uncharacterized protein n=1 Tax=Sulfitobacter geojensis TaxID=1342299 RepID=A0AAE3B649_9RHOB|nr:hypothetical protein [Sulfitobacter geojensis]MBM1688819.1 hypothetical protein [Sulfitobacter geojensis]MBM1692886.1 hypothetical protein [Sulfitobacter geojensis]MBM1705052.1 hypothetical protein [Sulfitobacter geojensis]MBM1709110.1 hypothetical protein [Sulfitobacter geojensis]MBM1713175.1 hypothetical protein [Sulfitobacter geojensis]